MQFPDLSEAERSRMQVMGGACIFTVTLWGRGLKCIHTLALAVCCLRLSRLHTGVQTTALQTAEQSAQLVLARCFSTHDSYK